MLSRMIKHHLHHEDEEEADLMVVDEDEVHGHLKKIDNEDIF